MEWLKKGIEWMREIKDMDLDNIDGKQCAKLLKELDELRPMVKSAVPANQELAEAKDELLFQFDIQEIFLKNNI